MNDGMLQCEVRKAVAARELRCRKVQEEVAKAAHSWASGSVLSGCEDPKMTRPFTPCSLLRPS